MGRWEILSLVLDFLHCAYDCTNYDDEVFNTIKYNDLAHVPWGIARANDQLLIGAILSQGLWLGG